jgi:ribonuclease VapC
LICVDSSALLATLLDEPEGARCRLALGSADELIISAGTVAEVLIVAGRRGVKQQMLGLLERLNMTVSEVTWRSALAAADVHQVWGKGRHPARLNYGDCFAYELASRMNCPLLYVGDDFAKTDVQSAL